MLTVLKKIKYPLLIIFLATVGAVFFFSDALLAQNPCHQRCSEEKSKAYQQCRAIAPTNQTARLQCFRNADDALKVCLQRCTSK